MNTCPAFERPRTWSDADPALRICREWAEATEFLTCTDEAVPSRDVVLRSPYNPSCHQWFADRALSAVVKIRYRRQHLANWAGWKEKTLALLKSFEGK